MSIEDALAAALRPDLDAFPTHHEDDWFVMVLNRSTSAAAGVEVEVERADGTVLTTTFDTVPGRPQERWIFADEFVKADAGDPAPPGTPDEIPTVLRRVTWRYSDAYGLANYEHELTWAAGADRAERADNPTG